MQTIQQRAKKIWQASWQMLPPIKDEAWITDVILDDLGSKHGSYSPDEGVITLSERLFWGTNTSQIMGIDIDGNSPPLTEPWCSRALHVCIHETLHAIGHTLGLDSSPEWLALGGWVEDDTNPTGTGRYHERRPGWGNEHSEWRFNLGQWWPRPYSQKSPQECFADFGTHRALGWHTTLVQQDAMVKMGYIQRHVWREAPLRQVAAARNKWQQAFYPG